MNADMVLILDDSTSITYNTSDNWNKYDLGFALGFVEAFPIGRNLTRFGVVQFSGNATPMILLKQYDNLVDLQNGIKALRPRGGDTNIADAMRVTRNVLFSEQNGARPGFKRLAFLLTDGVSNTEYALTDIEANKTKAAGVEVFTIGMTNQVNVAELQRICSPPIESHYFYVDAFSKLDTILEDVIASACNSISPPTTAITTSTTVTTTVTTTPMPINTTTPIPNTTMTSITTPITTPIPNTITTPIPITTTTPKPITTTAIFITTATSTNSTTPKTTNATVPTTIPTTTPTTTPTAKPTTATKG